MAFIQNNLTNYSVSQLCSALKFPGSTYYKTLVCVPSNRRQEYEAFGRKVKRVYEDSKKRYRAVKICRASVMDLCNRKIINYAYGTSITAELAVAALENACLNVRDTKGVILHSDLGSQYRSQAFEDCLGSEGILHSYRRKGMDLDKNTVQRIESGKRFVTDIELKVIVKVLGVSYEELLDS